MSDERIKVRLKTPAKVGTRWLKEGDEEVTAEEKAILEAEGLLEVEAPATDTGAAPGTTMTVTLEEFQLAVAAHAKALADAVTNAAIEEACAAIIRERDQAKARVAELEAEIARRDQAAVNQTTGPASVGDAGAVANSKASPPDDAAAPETHTPPSEKAAKTAPKKGAAAATKG